MYCSFYLGEKPYLLVIDFKMLKEIMVDAAENFSTSDTEVSTYLGWLLINIIMNNSTA